jgi:hypothetical protein
LEAISERQPVVIDHLVEEALQVGPGEGGTFVLHDASNLLDNRVHVLPR